MPTATVQVVVLAVVHLLQAPEPPYYEYPGVQAFIVVASLHPVLAPVVQGLHLSLTTQYPMLQAVAFIGPEVHVLTFGGHLIHNF